MNITWSKFYNLTNDDIQKHVPKSARVYLLWVKLQNGKWRCFYVGQADNLEKRLFDHTSDSESNGCIKTKVLKRVCWFEYAKIGKQGDRNGIEKFFYDHFSPECNKSDPGGTPIEVNLP